MKDPQTQTSRILKYLLSGRSLTSLEALKRFGCFRLASRINELSHDYKISREMIVTKSKKRIARYSINL